MSMPATTRPDMRPYQGYPYVQPAVFDVPSLTAAEVAALQKYNDLPRRQLGRQGASTESVVSDAAPTQSKQDEDRPVVYIDLPDDGAESSSNGSKDSDRPVVYIDIPGSNDSGVSERLRHEEPAFVQDTIYYDQFKDRRIDVRVPDRQQNAAGPSRPPPAGRNPPSTLNLGGSSQNSYSPSFLSKESYVYGSPQTSNDGFSLTPLEVREFPRPPPPYEEVDTQSQRPRAEEPEPPRTQVIITPTPPTVIYEAGATRKLVACQHCNSTVETIITVRNGMWTHLLAVIFFFIFFPFIILIYMMDSFKYKDHHCPHCNQIIAEELPGVCGNDVTYVR